MHKKTKSYVDEATDFHDKEIPKMDSNATCLAAISLDSALIKHRNYYLQVFLKSVNAFLKKEIKDWTKKEITTDLNVILMILMKNRLELNIKTKFFDRAILDKQFW